MVFPRTIRRLTNSLAVILLLSPPAIAQKKEKNDEPVKFVFKDRPSLRFGKVLRVDVRWKMHADLRKFSPQLQTDEGLFDMQRARLGVEGTFLRDFEYEVERELRQYFNNMEHRRRRTPKHQWRDVNVNFRHFRKAQIRIGKFKEPFGLEQTTGTMNLDFIHRTRLSDNLTPARDVGGVVHGRFFERGLNYEAGVFRHDGENAEPSIREPRARRTFVARVTGTPLRLMPVAKLLKNAELGIAAASTKQPEGLSGLRGQTTTGHTFFNHINVRGTRFRVGAQLNWTSGPFSLKSEFVHVRDHRMGQSIREFDLPPLIARAWYVAGTWAVTGEEKAGGIEPRHALFNHGFGAIELASRFEVLRFGSSEHNGSPSRSPRAANILGNSDRVWTGGVNWYVNSFVRIQINAIHDRVEDTTPTRPPIAGRQDYWTGMVRFQFVM